MPRASLELDQPAQDHPARFASDENAFAQAGHLMGAIVGLVFTLVGIIIVFKVGAATLPLILQSIGSIVNAFSSGTVNDTTGDAILSIAGLVVAVLAVLGVLFLFIDAAFSAGGGRGN